MSEPATLEALRRCQDAALGRYVRAVAARSPEGVPKSVMDRLIEIQRRELEDHLRRHRGRPGGKRPRAGQGRVPAAQADALEELESRLEEQSEGGRRGVTPEMAQDILNALTAQQGGVTPEMRDLLESVQRDGPSLTDETVRKLRRAAQAALAEGLELGVSPEIESFLREPDPQAPEPLPRAD